MTKYLEVFTVILDLLCDEKTGRGELLDVRFGEIMSRPYAHHEHDTYGLTIAPESVRPNRLNVSANGELAIRHDDTVITNVAPTTVFHVHVTYLGYVHALWRMCAKMMKNDAFDVASRF